MRPEAPLDPGLIPTLTEVLEVPDLGEGPPPLEPGEGAPQPPLRWTSALRPGAAAAPDILAAPDPEPAIDPVADPFAERLAAEVAAELMRLLEPEVRQLARRAVRRELETGRGN